MAELNFSLLKWQRTVFNDKTRFQVVMAGRRCGKIVRMILGVNGVICRVEDNRICVSNNSVVLAESVLHTQHPHTAPPPPPRLGRCRAPRLAQPCHAAMSPAVHSAPGLAQPGHGLMRALCDTLSASAVLM